MAPKYTLHDTNHGPASHPQQIVAWFRVERINSSRDIIRFDPMNLGCVTSVNTCHEMDFGALSIVLVLLTSKGYETFKKDLIIEHTMTSTCKVPSILSCR